MIDDPGSLQNEDNNIYKILIEESPTPMALYTGREMTVKVINPVMLKTWGKDASVAGKTYYQALPELEGQPYFKILDNVFTSGVAYEATEDRVDLVVDGKLQVYYFNFTYKPLKDVNGKIWGILNTAADVTELVRTRAKLADQIKQYQFVTNFMPVQLWTAGPDGLVDFINQRAVDFGGEPAENAGGASWVSFVHPHDIELSLKAWKQALATGEPYEVEFRLRDRYNHYRWHLARALPFKINGEIVKWFGTNTDIDEQKQSQRQRDDFLGIASHELKTPVTSIKAYAQVLGAMLTKEGETKKAEMVARMDSQVNRLTNLIGDLLDVTKINSGKLQFNKIWFAIDEVIKEAIEDLQHTTQKHQLITELKAGSKIFSDKDRIGQVLTNLVTNAIKYSPHSDKIIIRTKIENGQSIVCVQDFGIGIPGEKQDRVFEQFYRVSGNKQHTFPGLGLGLYISSEIIKREGGRMWVNSVENKGSTFSFSLPEAGPDDEDTTDNNK
jgi:PAS domain S-box-containing protein